MNNGFVKIPRTLIDLRAWKDNHPVLTPFEAYADLLQMAYYGREPQVRTFNHRQVTLHRGQFVGSRRYFMARWGWSEYQVRKALTKWTEQGLLQTIQTEHTTIFTLLQADESTTTQAQRADPHPHSYPHTHPDQTHESPLFADTLDDKDAQNHPPTHPASHPNNKKKDKEEEAIVKPSKARASVRRSRTAFIPPHPRTSRSLLHATRHTHSRCLTLRRLLRSQRMARRHPPHALMASHHTQLGPPRLGDDAS